MSTRYSGSIHDLIAARTEDNSLAILHDISSTLSERADRLGLHSLTEAELTVLAVQELQTAVMFDGYNSFIDGFRSHLVAYAVDALIRVGRPDAAEITQKAIDVLEITGPVTPEAIAIATDFDSEEASDRLMNKWYHCDELFYEHVNWIDDALWAYIRANRDHIDLSALAAS